MRFKDTVLLLTILKEDCHSIYMLKGGLLCFPCAGLSSKESDRGKALEYVFTCFFFKCECMRQTCNEYMRQPLNMLAVEKRESEYCASREDAAPFFMYN